MVTGDSTTAAPVIIKESAAPPASASGFGTIQIAQATLLSVLIMPVVTRIPDDWTYGSHGSHRSNRRHGGNGAYSTDRFHRWSGGNGSYRPPRSRSPTVGYSLLPWQHHHLAWIENNATAEFVHVAPNIWNLNAANCGTAAGGPQVVTTDFTVRTGVVKGSGTAEKLHCGRGRPWWPTSVTYTLMHRQPEARQWGRRGADCKVMAAAWIAWMHRTPSRHGWRYAVDGITKVDGSPAASPAGGCTFEIAY